mmetsp:Transcript_40511/g.101780  ORF Transcript_40511/g.101780 Transcript_40511/m.101780 type:complete len:281 (-) Transcript_40511:983-1825(-)
MTSLGHTYQKGPAGFDRNPQPRLWGPIEASRESKPSNSADGPHLLLLLSPEISHNRYSFFVCRRLFGRAARHCARIEEGPVAIPHDSNCPWRCGCCSARPAMHDKLPANRRRQSDSEQSEASAKGDDARQTRGELSTLAAAPRIVLFVDLNFTLILVILVVFHKRLRQHVVRSTPAADAARLERITAFHRKVLDFAPRRFPARARLTVLRAEVELRVVFAAVPFGVKPFLWRVLALFLAVLVFASQVDSGTLFHLDDTGGKPRQAQELFLDGVEHGELEG